MKASSLLFKLAIHLHGDAEKQNTFLRENGEIEQCTVQPA